MGTISIIKFLAFLHPVEVSGDLVVQNQNFMNLKKNEKLPQTMMIFNRDKLTSEILFFKLMISNHSKTKMTMNKP
jgi:hypothetical protein